MYRKTFLAISLCLFFINKTTDLFIDNEGYTPVCASTSSNPLIPNDTIITISANNVVLDINDYIVSQDPTNTMTGLVGIFINPNLSNITIKNGTIRNINGIGIYVSEGCQEIYLDNLSVISCAQSGIFFDGNPLALGIVNEIISDCLISSCTGLSSNPAYGLRMVGTRNGVIDNCIINNNKTLSATAGYGISIESCSSLRFDNCKTYNNGGTSVGAGVSLLNSIGCAFYDCSSYSNIVNALSATSTACGYLINTSTSILFNACNATGNISVLGSGIGFNSNDNLNLLFRNCMASSNRGGLLAAGFYFGNTDLNFGFLNNFCSANLSNNTAYGLFLNGAQGFNIRSNTFASNTGINGYGLFDATTDTNNLFMSNLSYNNTTTGYYASFTTGELPVFFASNNDFSSLDTISQYFNIAIVPG